MQPSKKNRLVFKIIASYLLMSSSLMLFLLWFNHYSSSQVYVVYLDGTELGLVSDYRETESFVDDLVLRCSSLYGLDLQLEESVTFARELRVGSEPDPFAVRESIRRKVSFLTSAYLIKVDGKPLAPVSCKSELAEVMDTLIESYSDSKSIEDAGNIFEVVIVEEIKLEECRVHPESLFDAGEILSLLIDNNNPDHPEDEAVLLAGLDQQDHLFSSHFDNNDTNAVDDNKEGLGIEKTESQAEENPIRITVKTVEEKTVIKAIPFPVDHVEDQNLFVNQSEIKIPGQDGEMEVVVHIVRENGVEVDRIVIEETILEEPVTQVERIGVKKLSSGVTSMGSGSFIWPVQGEGIVYNGFKPGHTAIDIHIEHGTNILAADSGTVYFTGWGSTQGNYIIIHHGAYWTLYLHNSVNLVQKGDHVSRGQVIGRVGATGRAKGAHLHFEIREDDGSRQWRSYYQHKAVNPMQFFR